MLTYIRGHLGVKLFISYLVVILVGVIILVTTAEFIIPTAFDRHLAAMSALMSDMMGTSTLQLEQDLFNSFRSAVTEAVIFASIAACGAAILVSVLISRQVVAPVRDMMKASEYIADGHYEERVHITGDISKGELDELSQLAVRFNQMAESLEQTENLRRQLIGDVAHELRTPLTTIKGSVEGLIDGVLPAEERTYQQISNEADRLRRLVDDLQELSRVEVGGYELNLKPTSCYELVETAVNRLEHQFVDKGVVLKTILTHDIPRVLADEGRIGQVLINILGNALQFTPSNGIVSISARGERNFVEFSVTDTGIGIPPDQLTQVFTRFYRVDKSRSRAGGGSGIGLTISKYLVEAHGGRIWAISPGRGHGSTFFFTLPVAKHS